MHDKLATRTKTANKIYFETIKLIPLLTFSIKSDGFVSSFYFILIETFRIEEKTSLNSFYDELSIQKAKTIDRKLYHLQLNFKLKFHNILFHRNT